jgi:hypothetical protein
LPMVVRITPFTRPAGLDGELAARGFGAIDDTRVMIAPRLTHLELPVLPSGLMWAVIGHAAMAEAVGALRASPLAQRAAHAERLANSPVPFRARARATLSACTTCSSTRPCAARDSLRRCARSC